jgi:hypothetical protein
MQLVVDAQGTVRCLYDETIALASLGSLRITRASHLEPTPDGFWLADLAQVGGPVLGPFYQRSDALAAERHWLLANWLPSSQMR